MAFGPLPEPGTPPLSGQRPQDEREFLNQLAATMALAARPYQQEGLVVFYLDPLLTKPSDHFGYSDHENGIVVIGASEGTPPGFWRKIVAHEIGHIVFNEYNYDGAGNLMSHGAQELENPSFDITPEQCAKARRTIQTRWPTRSS